MIKIAEIIPGSIADKLNLQCGDKIIKINDKEIKDYIDYEYETADNFFTLTVKKGGSITSIELTIERNYGEELGIVPDGIIYDSLKKCKNNCIFCFVDQQPPDMRKSLYIKDDDYRFSFLQGSYITLTNLSPSEFARIIEYRLSPLYISVHTTNPELRKIMMKNPEAAYINEQLSYLADNGIRFNTQVVLCPGVNDGQELDRTISDLLTLHPAVNSLGIVPVGLTKYRENLKSITPYDKQEAEKLLDQIEEWQEVIRRKCDKNWLYAADEFYLLADREIPAIEEYHEFPQLENGIGLTRRLWDSFSGLDLNLKVESDKKNIAVVTSELGKKAILPLVSRLNLLPDLFIDIITVKNKYFGESVTVTGLLTAADLKERLSNYYLNEKIIIPAVVLNDQGLFLDDKSAEWLKKQLPSKELIFCHDFQDIMEVIQDG